MGLIGHRFPHRSDVIAVLGVIVFVCYSWSLLGFFNELSSFILYFTLAEIAEIFAFMMAFALVESLLLTAVLYLVSGLLPPAWFRDGFAFKAFVIVVIATVASILLQKSIGNEFPSTLMLSLHFIVPIVLIALLIGFIKSRPRLQAIIRNVEDRILLLTFIYVPIGLISLMAVLYRNLL